MNTDDEHLRDEIRVTEDGSRTLYSATYGQTFHSHYGALTESEHIFFRANGLLDALAAGRNINVLEIGYGTGLNALLLAARSAKTETRARLTSLENRRIPAALLRELGYDALPTVDGLTFREWIAFEETGKSALQTKHFQLKVIEGDALQTDWAARGPYDFVWHDAFSPDANAELWTDNFLSGVFETMAPGGVLSTYTVKGAVRRTLIAAGFVVEKVEGPPGGKPQVLVATKPVTSISV